MPCIIAGKHEETRGAHVSSRKTRYACTIEAHVSTRTGIGATQPRDHEDHIAERRLNSLTHYNLVHKPTPIPQAMKISDAKAAVDKEWKKLEKMPAWKVTKVKSKTEVIQKAQEGGTFHFASLMDLCHLKNLELEQQQKKGRVVLRSDVVKDDSGSYAVFADQGFDSVTNDCRQSSGRHCQTAWMRTSKRHISLRPSQNGRHSTVETSQV